MTSSAADTTRTGNPWFRIGLDAWRFGLDSSMGLGLRAIDLGALQARALADVVGSLAGSPPAPDAAATAERAQRDAELLAAVIPGADGARRALPMYAGSRDIVPWHYDQ